MYRLVLLSVLIPLGVQCATFYPRSYDSTPGYPGYPSSTISNSYENYPYKGVSYGSDIANFPDVTRYPNYSPNYGYTSYSTPGYSTPGYSSYSTTRYPTYGNGYSTGSSNTLYGGGSGNLNYNNQGYGMGVNDNNRYGSGYGTSSGSGYASGYPNYGTGSTLGGYNSPDSRGGYSSYEAPFMRNSGGCINRSPQNGIWVDSLMGMWYGVEYIQHMGFDSHVFDSNAYDTRTCIVIHIAEPMDRPSTENQPFHMQAINAKFRQQYRHLRLLWDEAGYTTEYALYFRNDTAGYWHVFDRQNGTLASRDNYNHFSGTVQVLKAVNDHLVLNFCEEGNNGMSPQLYSVLFSRNPGEMNHWDIESVHSLLQTKKLSTASRRMVCGNNRAENIAYSMFFSFLTSVLAYVVGS